MNIKQKIISSVLILVLTFCLFGSFNVSCAKEEFLTDTLNTNNSIKIENTPTLLEKEEYYNPNYDLENDYEFDNPLLNLELPSKILPYSNTINVLVSVKDREEIEEEIASLEETLIVLAKIIYREARGIKFTSHKAAVVWCILNRVDDNNGQKTILEIATAKHQFCWVPDTPVREDLYEIAKDVVIRWLLEKRSYENVGRVLPKNYLFFAGNGKLNRFRTGYRTKDYWDWSLPSPYEGD